jgi:hypothetical protein
MRRRARRIFLSSRTEHLVPSRGFHGRLAASLLAVAVAVAFALATSAGAQSMKPRPVSSYTTPVGVPLRTIIVFGDQYEGGDELYDVTCTVLEVVRGEAARKMARDANAENQSPGAGLEYLLARVRFQFSARAEPHHYDYELDPAQFSAMSAATVPYAVAALSSPVKPELRATLRSGDSAEGWVAFVVPRGDHTPLMIFRADVGSVIHEGDASYFKLYTENTGERRAPTKPSATQ